MAKMSVDTKELHHYGREMGFILAELVEGFLAGMQDYKKALEAAEKEEEQAGAEEKQEEKQET